MDKESLIRTTAYIKKYESELETCKPKRVRRISFISHRVHDNIVPNFTEKSVDLNHAVKQLLEWDIQFGQNENMTAYKFIDLLTEKNKSLKMSDDQLLEIVPKLLSGLALKWFNFFKKRLYTWQDFVVNFTQDFQDANKLPCLNPKKKRLGKNVAPQKIKKVPFKQRVSY